MRWCTVLVTCCLISTIQCQNCRGEEPRERECENVCDKDGNCKIRAALLLPKNPKYAASLQIVEPVLELALRDPVIQDLVPSWLTFEWLAYDVTDCDAAYAVITSIDAYNDCAHVFFGPACDFALASVARIARFLGNTGTPLVTTGGFSFDFVEKKQSCEDEYYMLVRASPLGFKDMAFFLIDVLRQFNWGRAIILYDTPAFDEFVGMNQGGFLLASNLHQFMFASSIDVLGREMSMQDHENMTEMLTNVVGNIYASELFELGLKSGWWWKQSTVKNYSNIIIFKWTK